MKIPVTSPTIRRKEMDAVLSCMVSEQIGPGDMNLRLVQTVKDSFSVDGCVAVRSPAIALKYALKALDISKNEGVIISALAPSWQFYAVEELGYTPIIVDVSQETSLVTFDSIEEGIKKGGRVILLHETMGKIPDFSVVSSFGIPVIEDISQSAGSFMTTTNEKGEEIEKKAGSFGVFSILGLEEKDILTAGGGAVLMAPGRREWTVLKKYTEKISSADMLPDINAALAFIQLKERARNEEIRQKMYDLYIRSLMQSRHKSFISSCNNATNAVYSFPVVLSSGLKDVKQYTSRKEIDIESAFEKSIAAEFPEETEHCINAQSLVLRCVLFPLYPRLGMTLASKIAKVLGTLP